MSIISLLCALFALSTAVESAQAPAVDCSGLVLNMADCLSFVTAGSTTSKPEGTCCAGLKTVLKTDAECLCEAFRNSAQLGVTLNVSKAITLPSACHVSAPSVTNCGLSVDTGAAPAVSPSAATPSSIDVSPSSSTGANEVSPGPAPVAATGGPPLSGSALLLLLSAAAALF